MLDVQLISIAILKLLRFRIIEESKLTNLYLIIVQSKDDKIVFNYLLTISEIDDKTKQDIQELLHTLYV